MSLAELGGNAGAAAMFDPSAPLTKCPLLLRHTAIPIQTKVRRTIQKDGVKKVVKTIVKEIGTQDRLVVQGEEAPDSGALPEESWWSKNRTKVGAFLLQRKVVLDQQRIHVDIDTICVFNESR